MDIAPHCCGTASGMMNTGSAAATIQLNGQSIFSDPGANPAGDPRRLLPWLVDHCRRHAIALPAGTFITAGSFTGMYFPKKPGTVTGRIAGPPAIT